MPLPDLVVHADWGTDPRKRWMCAAAHPGDGRFEAGAPEPVGDLATFWERLQARAPGTRVVVGFDFPIGLPAAYARRAGIGDFRTALPRFGIGSWKEFYEPAQHPGEIHAGRPFYPHRPGGTRQAHLLEGLGVPSMKHLLRRCERRTGYRNAASPLFWLVGAKQVGRAAITGWRDLLAPGLADLGLPLRLWPFDGDLPGLLEPGGIVAAETYPAEACLHVGITPPGRGWSKRSPDDRRRHAGPLLRHAASRNIALAPGLQDAVRSGFGEAAGGEDPFDAALGLFSMLDVVLGQRPEGAPEDPEIRRVEGWILGQT